MTQVIPTSIFIPGKGRVYFPKELRGAVVEEAEAQRIYAKVCPERFSAPAAVRDLPIVKRGK